MAYKDFGDNVKQIDTHEVRFIADAETDLTGIASVANSGDCAFVIASGAVYVADTSGEFTQMVEPSTSGGGESGGGSDSGISITSAEITVINNAQSLGVDLTYVIPEYNDGSAEFPYISGDRIEIAEYSEVTGLTHSVPVISNAPNGLVSVLKFINLTSYPSTVSVNVEGGIVALVDRESYIIRGSGTITVTGEQ